jgi:hypothetical protein
MHLELDGLGIELWLDEIVLARFATLRALCAHGLGKWSQIADGEFRKES